MLSSLIFISHFLFCLLRLIVFISPNHVSSSISKLKHKVTLIISFSFPIIDFHVRFRCLDAKKIDVLNHIFLKNHQDPSEALLIWVFLLFEMLTRMKVIFFFSFFHFECFINLEML